jgi:SAM-dependent methyltransferase
LGYRVIGIDLDWPSLKHAQARARGSDTHFVLMDAARLGFTEKFDIIVCSEVIEHLPDPAGLLRALPGHLKSNGSVVITTPNGYGAFELSSQLFYVQPLRLLKALGLGPWLKKLRRQVAGQAHGLDSMNRASPHVQFFTLRRLRNLLTRCGLQVVQIAHSDWLEGATPLSLIYSRSKRLSRLDQSIADRLPHFMASGWYLVCRATSLEVKHRNV